MTRVKVYDEYDNLVGEAPTEDQAQIMIDRLMSHDDSRTYYYESGVEFQVGPRTGFLVAVVLVLVWAITTWAVDGFPR